MHMYKYAVFFSIKLNRIASCEVWYGNDITWHDIFPWTQHDFMCVSHWCCRQSRKHPAAGVRVLHKVISHSNIWRPRSHVHIGNVALVTAPSTVFQPDDFLWNSQKSKTCSRHAREAYSGVHWKRHSLKFIVWWCSQAYFVKVSTARLPDNELWIWSYFGCARLCLWWAF